MTCSTPALMPPLKSAVKRAGYEVDAADWGASVGDTQQHLLFRGGKALYGSHQVGFI